MTDLDPETKARIQAEERYRAELREQNFPIGAWLGALAGLLLTVAPFTPMFLLAGQPVNFLIANNATGKGLIGVGIICFLLALFPATRFLNIFLGFIVLALVAYIIVGGGWSFFLQNQPQFGWLLFLLGSILAMTAGVLSTKRT